MTELPEGVDAVLDYLRTTRGFDFTGYKSASIHRRITKRIEATGCASYAEYLDYLQVHPDELPVLFNTILINVTAFLRDPEAWDALREDALPSVLAAAADRSQVRVWSAGCASGEEAYSLAMILCDALGERDFRERVKIYGTDVDEEALDQARRGVYSTKQLEAVPEGLRERYFERIDQRFVFRKDLRCALIFGRNDLVRDAPISRVDVLVCRNTLMYFSAETQSAILRRFHFALQPTGCLFPGKSEMLLSRGELFRPISLKRRLFTKVERPVTGERMTLNPPDSRGPSEEDLAFAAFDAGPVAQLIVDRARTLVGANEAARSLLQIVPEDIGRPLKDLRASYRPAELRAGLDDAFGEGRPVDAGTVSTDDGGDARTLEVRLAPMRRSGDDITAVTVTFLDVTPQKRLEQDLERSRDELGAAYAELQSTIEELETTNDELRSTIEELETMNEELRSSNEEMEGVGVVVVDHDQRVQVWNGQSEELWGVRGENAVEEHVLGLDVGLPLDDLRTQLREVLHPGGVREELVLDAVDRRGRSFRCHVTIAPLAIAGADGSAAILLTRRLSEE